MESDMQSTHTTSAREGNGKSALFTSLRTIHRGMGMGEKVVPKREVEEELATGGILPSQGKKKKLDFPARGSSRSLLRRRGRQRGRAHC